LLLVDCSKCYYFTFFFFSSRRRHTRFSRDWSSDVCSSDLADWDVTLTAGYEEVPADIVDLVCSMVGYAMAEAEGGGYARRSDLRSEERRVGKEGRTRWSPKRARKEVSDSKRKYQSIDMW